MIKKIKWLLREGHGGRTVSDKFRVRDNLKTIAKYHLLIHETNAHGGQSLVKNYQTRKESSMNAKCSEKKNVSGFHFPVTYANHKMLCYFASRPDDSPLPDT